MPKETTNAGRLGSLLKLADALNGNAAELPQLEGSRTQFLALLGQAQEAVKRQGALTAEKQEMSKQLKTALREGERLSNVLRLAVKQHYGIRAEKLAEFGLQPFRGRPRLAKQSPDEAKSPAPAAHPLDPKP